MICFYKTSIVLFIAVLVIQQKMVQSTEQLPVQAFLVRGETKSPWRWDTHQTISNSYVHRRKRNSELSTSQESIRISLDALPHSVWNLNLRRKSHPVTPNTIVEWVAENGERTLTRGIDTDNCWYTGAVENETDSIVSLGICQGLSGFIRTNNQTMLLEPVQGNPTYPNLTHVIYPWTLANNSGQIVLQNDQDFGVGRRHKRNILSNQVDYDEEGNEVVDTVHFEELEEYSQSVDDEIDEENEISNSIDDDVVISDMYSEIEDYDVHLSPVVTEAKSLEEAEESPSSNRTTLEPENTLDIDGFSVDKLWEGESQAVKRKKPVAKTTLGEDSAKFLELALAVDHTVIKFHGKQRVQQYVLTLLNIVSAIYEDSSLEANLRLVVSRLIFYEDRKQGQVREGNSKRSLENVNAWNAGLLRNAASEWPHDIAVWLTRYDLGGPSGYAPVAGVCDPDRSCSLNRDEGLTSAFIIAHEVGHVLGFSHDGDVSAGNDCHDEALQGSVMAPMVAATFSRFHWSRCTHWEYHFKQHNWKCLKNQPSVNTNATIVQSAIQYSYSLDEQCRMEFGEGYFLCRSFALNDPCTHLWCGHKSSPQLCKTKKGPPLEGTPCGKDKWCIKGFCEAIGKRKKVIGPVVKNPRDGNWSVWSDWNTCSRTCSVGVRFRTRKCNNPTPANGGKSCQGKSEDSELCNTNPCAEWTDFRGEQCATIPLLFPTNESLFSMTWLPWEVNNQSALCRLTCVARETGDIFESSENVVDGTACSYERSNGICIQGQCQIMGCDKRLGSPAVENECGVCQGKPGDCTVASRHYSGAPRLPHRRVVVIPRGARNIRIKEEPNSSNRLAIKARNSQSWILNGSFPITEDVATFYVITAGTRFTYNSVFGLETMRARGPLLSDLTLMIVPGLVREHANVTVTWSMPPKSHRKKNPGPDVSNRQNQYFWELAGWSVCSRSCGEGTQTQVWYCRDRQTGHVVRRKHCNILSEPEILTRLCNTFSCDFRWVTGPWEGCSHMCGTDGVQMRMIYCVRTAMVTSSQSNNTAAAITKPEFEKNILFDEHQTAFSGPVNEARRLPEVTDDDISSTTDRLIHPIVDAWKATIKDNKKKLAVENEILHWNPNAITDPALCKDKPPNETQPCSRIPCNGTWVEKNWTKCSTTCGIGRQEMQFICVSSKGKSNKELGGYLSMYEEEAFAEQAIDYQEDFHEEAAYGFNKRQTEGKGNSKWKNFLCGPRPTLVRSCVNQECPLTLPPNGQDTEKCKDLSRHCNLPVLQRYCALTSFQTSCCHSCSNYLSK
ncbi:A disintegrin and metalloproteinase with thrombospondin motifs 16-like isoform X2 [Daphnia carinata]|uniref:A disintegrin and metalloproteinase with thrombospondin motifs 16-like isoform X2 n=1 Tax=Daphnia carinata TaxID=120202 RepID=UPI00257DF94B|nr:A disintegrin and metalloproteinase with thrombospondin motifs 16-like isoform X2 [Daphnia carinata]